MVTGDITLERTEAIINTANEICIMVQGSVICVNVNVPLIMAVFKLETESSICMN